MPEHSVLVFDMARTGEPDGEHTVRGFRNLETAQAYAQARVRASVEELRKPGIGAAELATLWHIYGEDCIVVGDDYRGKDWLHDYIAEPAAPADTDWMAFEPKPRRFYAALLFSDSNQHSTWLLQFFESTWRPGLHDLMDRFGDAARRKLHDKGVETIEPLTLHIGSLFELPKPPDLPGNLGKPLKNWRITVEFVCHDVKFGATVAGVFTWPTEPDGAIRDQMVHVVVCDAFAMRGDGPEMADYTEILSVNVEETADLPTC